MAIKSVEGKYVLLRTQLSLTASHPRSLRVAVRTLFHPTSVHNSDTVAVGQGTCAMCNKRVSKKFSNRN